MASKRLFNDILSVSYGTSVTDIDKLYQSSVFRMQQQAGCQSAVPLLPPTVPCTPPSCFAHWYCYSTQHFV